MTALVIIDALAVLAAHFRSASKLPAKCGWTPSLNEKMEERVREHD